MAGSPTRKIVVLGKTGYGKSNLANTIFGEELFTTNHTPSSGTKKCQAETKAVNGRSITLIDTPGFFDVGGSKEKLKPEIVRCITKCAPGPHAFLIVLKVEKYTKHEQAVITEMKKCFSKKVFKYATVVFTHGDQLPEGQTIENFVSQNTILSDLVKKCGGRCHVIDNKYWKNNQQDKYRNNQFQVEELLKSIDTTLEANEGRYYTNNMLQAVEDKIQKEEARIRKSSGNMSDEEIRELAKDRVSMDLLIKLAGITTGALLGALCGALSVVGLVVTFLIKSLSEPGQAFTKTAAVTAVGGAIGGTAGGVIGGSAAAAAAAGEVIGVTAGGITVGMTAAAAIGVVAGACTVAGAVKGGFTGYDAVDGAKTPQEAAKRAAKAVTKEALAPFKELCIKAKDKTESKPLLSSDS